MNEMTKVFEGNEIRIVEDNGMALFVASDVAKTLGYKEPHKAVSRHCKGGMKRPVLTSGGTQEMLVIREPDVYRLVTNSKLPAAEAFENWVMEEVLPSIRKDGGYIAATPDESPEVIMARGLLAAQSTIERLKNQHEAVVSKLEEQKPLVAFAEVVNKSDDSLLVREYVKAISKRGFVIGEKRMFQWLRDNNFIDRKNAPYQRYIDQGLFEVTEYPVTRTTGIQLKFTTRITAKGQVYFYDKLKRGEAV